MAQLEQHSTTANASPFKISGYQRRQLRKELALAKLCLIQSAAREDIEEEDLQPLREEIWDMQKLLKERI